MNKISSTNLNQFMYSAPEEVTDERSCES